MVFGEERKIGGVSAWVWINGALQDSGEARVSPLDHGWTVGHGVFETLIAYEGRLFAWSRHEERLRASGKVMNLPVPEGEELRQACAEVLRANHLHRGRARVRVTISGGMAPFGSLRGTAPPTVVVTATSVEPAAPWADVVMVPYTRNATGALVGVKTTSYGENVVALEAARAQGASEAMVSNTSGFLCEGTGSNVFLVQEGELITPPLASGCLAGVTRALVLELAREADLPCVEREVPAKQLALAEEAFLTSTIREVQAIRQVDGRSLPPFPGPMTKLLREAYEKKRQTSLDP